MNVSKCDQYCTPNAADGLFSVFLTRVTLGEPFRTTTTLRGQRRPPTRPDGSGTLYDSVIGQTGPTKYVEFVVYDRRQTYPEYLLQYRRVWVDPPAASPP